jgi:adenylosuccinate synthase
MTTKFEKIYQSIYQTSHGLNFEKITPSPFKLKGRRANSIAVAGGALGDEGKGRITDELTAEFLKVHKKVFHYRDNGGANAGHTVEIGTKKIALHQLGSGVLQRGCTVVLGKEMVLHPQDLVTEILEVLALMKTKQLPAKLLIDELALSCLDTHRAFEAVLKMKASGSKAATGRGISPAYSDVLYRNPIKMRDLVASNWRQRVLAHYQHYELLCRGYGFEMSQIEVPRLTGKNTKVGNFKQFTASLGKAISILKVILVRFMNRFYQLGPDQPMVFESQALGLDVRYGVFPDITASNCAFDGIYSSTEGIVDDRLIAVRAATIKATYTSSVGTRVLPTMMEENLAKKIRADANEYGATTKRPRDIAYIDLPMLSFLFKVGRVEQLILTHLDIAYLDIPVKVCVGYELNGREVDYRPDQTYLSQVKQSMSICPVGMVQS